LRGLEMTVGENTREIGDSQNKQTPIKLDINRFWVVPKSLDCAMTFVLLMRHHTTLTLPPICHWFTLFCQMEGKTIFRVHSLF